LVFIAHNSTVHGPTTYAALHAEVERRTTAGTHLVLPDSFTVPGPAWTSGYRAEAAKAHQLPADYRTLGGAVPLADCFISPLLGRSGPQGMWHPESREWR
jgi:hypothetical protein